MKVHGNTGKVHTSEWNRKVSEAKKGFRHTEEEKQKRSIAALSLYKDPGYRKRVLEGLAKVPKSKFQLGAALSREGLRNHQTFLQERIKILETLGAKVIYADLKGYSKPDLIHYSHGTIICEDVKTSKGRRWVEIEKEIVI